MCFCFRFSDEQRRMLAVKAKALGKRLAEIVTIIRPETVLRWHKKLVAKKYDYSKARSKPGRPKTNREIEQLVLEFVKENKTWRYRGISAIEFFVQMLGISCDEIVLILPATVPKGYVLG